MIDLLKWQRIGTDSWYVSNYNFFCVVKDSPDAMRQVFSAYKQASEAYKKSRQAQHG